MYTRVYKCMSVPYNRFVELCSKSIHSAETFTRISIGDDRNATTSVSLALRYLSPSVERKNARAYNVYYTSSVVVFHR